MRAKFHMFAQAVDESSNVPNQNQIPSARLRISAPLFAFASFLDVNYHSAGNAISDLYARDMSPTTSSANARVYRVDMDPPEFNWTTTRPGNLFTSHQENPTRMGFFRMFEIFGRSSEPQEQGYLCLAESSIGTYPSQDGTMTTLHEYGLNPQDWTTPSGGNQILPGGHFYTADVFEQNAGLIPGTVLGSNTNGQANGKTPNTGTAAENLAQDITFTPSNDGFAMSTVAVDNRADQNNDGTYATATVDWFYGNKNSTDTNRVRIMPATLYRARFQASASVASSVNAMIRFRLNGIDQQFTARLEVGGSTGGSEFSWGYLPGTGSAWATGPGGTGMYDVITVSPWEINPTDMSKTSDGHLGSLPAQGQPGILTGPRAYHHYWRELHPGADIVDEYITAGAAGNSKRSKGHVKIHNIKIQSAPNVTE